MYKINIFIYNNILSKMNKSKNIDKRKSSFENQVRI